MRFDDPLSLYLPINYIKSFDMREKICSLAEFFAQSEEYVVAVTKENSFCGVIYVHDLMQYIFRKHVKHLGLILNEPISVILRHENYPTIDYNSTLGELLEKLITHERPEGIIITEEDELKGYLSLKTLYSATHDWHRMWREMHDIIDINRRALISPNALLKRAAHLLIKNNVGIIVVRWRGRVRGIISHYDILRILSEKNTLDRVMEGDDEYFLEISCRDVLNSKFSFLELKDLNEHTFKSFVADHGYILVLTDRKSKKLKYFMTDNDIYGHFIEYVKKRMRYDKY